MKKTAGFSFLLLGIFLSALAQNPAEPTAKVAIARLEKDITKLMQEELSRVCLSPLSAMEIRAYT